jgi:hypothetical protein
MFKTLIIFYAWSFLGNSCGNMVDMGNKDTVYKVFIKFSQSTLVQNAQLCVTLDQMV